MILPNKLNLSMIKGINRVLVWILLIALTALLLLFPVNLINEYHPLQAPYLFENLPLFGTLFCLWTLLLLLLLFSRKDEGNKLTWENLALAALFGLVFLGFWVVITPYGKYADAIYNMGHVRYLVDTGNIAAGNPAFSYFDYPGMHLLVSALSQVSGLSIFESATVFLIFNAVLFSSLLYIMFVKALKSNRLAFLGISLVIAGSTVIADDITVFYPRALGFTMLAGFLVLLNKSDKILFGTTAADKLLMLILFGAMVISYFPVPFLVSLILFGISIIQVIARDREAPSTVTTAALLMLMLFAWGMYWTWNTFNTLAGFLPQVTQSLFSGEFLTAITTLSAANAGGSMPLWATVTRYLWWALLGLATILGLSNLLRIRKLSFMEKVETGALLGLIVMSVLGFFGTAMGSQFARYLMYAPLFCAPILLRFLYKSGIWGKRGLALLSSAAFILALPTFLSSVNTISTDAIYSYEIDSGKFLETHSNNQGKNLLIFRVAPSSTSWTTYYIPNAMRVGISAKASFNESELWTDLAKLLTDFQNTDFKPREQKIFVMGEKSKISYQHILGISPDDPGWAALDVLSTTNLIYNNEHTTMYILRN